jgi:N-carbamoylputrescine amidase
MSLRCAVIQQHCTDSTADNLDLTEKLLTQAKQQGAQLALLPELHNGYYFCQNEDASVCQKAESIPGPTSNRLSKIAKQLDLVLVGSVFEKRQAGVYHNTAIVFERDGELVGRYRKMHIPDDPGYYEKYYFTPGDAPLHANDPAGFRPIKTSVGTLGVLVCWDQWYPEAARLMALAGADLLLYPTAIGWDTRDDSNTQQLQHSAWQTVQRGHAVANHLPVLVANRWGQEPDPSQTRPGNLFWGQSFVAGQQGELLAVADSKQDQVLMIDIDFQRTTELRQLWPFLRDRRIDAYQGLLQRSLV